MSNYIIKVLRKGSDDEWDLFRSDIDFNFIDFYKQMCLEFPNLEQKFRIYYDKKIIMTFTKWANQGESIPLSNEQWLKDLSIQRASDFDLEKLGNHPQVKAQHEIEVDLKLKELINRLNSWCLITTHSCQYNFLGYATIDLYYGKFQALMNIIRNQHLRKYGNEYHLDSLWSAIAHWNGTREQFHEGTLNICKFKCHVTEPCSSDPDEKAFDWQNIRIEMLIHPDNINKFVTLWDNLFNT
jgi:hypothetical protein